jgi:hypothetical protein
VVTVEPPNERSFVLVALAPGAWLSISLAD